MKLGTFARMKLLNHIHALVAIAALLVSLVAVPAVNAAASHSCCPPEMAMSMSAAEHKRAMMDMAAQDADSGMQDTTGEERPEERPCDLSCCGVAPTTATAGTLVEAASFAGTQGVQRITVQSQLVSASLGVQPPPPKA